MGMKPLPVFALSLALLSCTEEKEIPTFRLADAESAPAPALPESKDARPLRWIAPETWDEETPGQFQVALYRIAPGITAAVSKLPGDAGGMAANVNRWRKQVGLQAAEKIDGEAIALEEGPSSQARWFELKGAERSILAAIIPVDGETWFFKLDSPTVALETARPGFMGLLKSVEIGSAAEAAAPAIDLLAPAKWVKHDAGEKRFASFRIPASGSHGIDGDVSVISLPGDGGTTLANVNLWRAQLRLPPLEKDDDPALGETTRGPAGAITLIHMVSAEPLFSDDRHAAISAAILRTGKVTWCFKIAGEAGMVAAHRPKFVEFVRTAKAR